MTVINVVLIIQIVFAGVVRERTKENEYCDRENRHMDVVPCSRTDHPPSTKFSEVTIENCHSSAIHNQQSVSPINHDIRKSPKFESVVDWLSQIFTKQKRSVLELVLHSCNGELVRVLEHFLAANDPAVVRQAAFALEAVGGGYRPTLQQPVSVPGRLFGAGGGRSAFTPLGSSSAAGLLLHVPPIAHQSLPFAAPGGPRAAAAAAAAGFTPRAAAFSAEALLRPSDRSSTAAHPADSSGTMLMGCPAGLYSMSATAAMPMPAFPYAFGNNMFFGNYNLRQLQSAYSNTSTEIRSGIPRLPEVADSAPPELEPNYRNDSTGFDDDKGGNGSPISVDIPGKSIANENVNCIDQQSD